MCVVSTTAFHFLLRKVFETYGKFITQSYSFFNSVFLLYLLLVLKSLSNYFFIWLAYVSFVAEC